MKILKLIGLMLDYPRADWLNAAAELELVIRQAREISPAMREELVNLLTRLCEVDLMDLQERYDGLFDRGRATSLLLFEHVHGESRSRGQAMVDLLALYQRAGFEIQVRELPDYLPLYLEFLSTRPATEAREGLAEVAHILALMAERLRDRESEFAVLFDALQLIAAVDIDQAAIRQQVEQEERDDSLEALDKIWEEEMVTFLGDDASAGCSIPGAGNGSNPLDSPVQWVAQGKTAAGRASQIS